MASQALESLIKDDISTAEARRKKIGPASSKRHAAAGRIYTIQDHLPTGSLRKLCKKSGIKRTDTLVYEVCRAILQKFTRDMLKPTVAYMEHANRKTVSTKDVVHGLRHMGKSTAGFDELK